MLNLEKIKQDSIQAYALVDLDEPKYRDLSVEALTLLNGLTQALSVCDHNTIRVIADAVDARYGPDSFEMLLSRITRLSGELHIPIKTIYTNKN